MVLSSKPQTKQLLGLLQNQLHLVTVTGIEFIFLRCHVTCVDCITSLGVFPGEMPAELQAIL